MFFKELFFSEGPEHITYKLLFHYRGHGMGTNSIDIKQFMCSEKSTLKREIFICTGGDDQAITLCRINLDSLDKVNT